MKKLIFFLAIALTLGSCKTQEKVTGTNNGGAVNTVTAPVSAVSLASRQAAWTTLKCGGHIDFTGGGKSLGANMQMRMERGKAIYISVRPIMGIEVARMVITDSTILVVDKIHRRYIRENVSLITSGVPVTVEALQDIFLGRIHLLGQGSLSPANASRVEVTAGDDGYTVVPQEDFKGFDYRYLLSSDARVAALEVMPATKKTGARRAYAVNYLEHTLTKAGPVATSLDVATMIGGNELQLSLDYNNLKWNEDVDIMVEDPSGYKRYSGNELLNMLAQ